MAKDSPKKRVLYPVLLFCFLLTIPILYITFFRSKKIDKQYNAVVIDLDNSKLIGKTTVRMKGIRKPQIPIIRKSTIWDDAHIYIDYLDFTMDDTLYSMYDIHFFEKLKNNSFFTAVEFSCPVNTPNPFDGDDIDSYIELHQCYMKALSFKTNNTYLDEIVLWIDGYNPKSKYYKQVIIGPANTLEEGLAIYNKLVN